MSASPTPGSLLGDRYRLDEVIGSGGMATVWAATDMQLERPVAVKVIAETLARDEAFMGRFRREAQIAASFSHPNVVRVYDFSADEELPFLVMERVRGGTLAEWAPAEGRELDPAALATQLLSALEHIHAAGIVHRDVKAANVLLDRHGDARLTDFGIARSEAATRYTQTGEVIGTLRYMAPEVQRGEEATPRSDLYSLGVVLRESFGEAAIGLAGLIGALTALDPAQRPESAAAASALLDGGTAETLAATEPTEPMGVAGLPADGTTQTRTARRGAGLALLGLGALAAVILTLALGGDEEDPSPTRPKGQTTTVTERTVETTTEAQAAPPAETPAATPAEPSTCEELEEEKAQLEEQQKAAEERLKENKEAKGQAKKRFDERKKALDEEIKACEEAEKEAAE